MPLKHYTLTYTVSFPSLEAEDTTLFQALPNTGPTSCFLCYLLFLQHPLFHQIGPTILCCCLCFPLHLLLQCVERATWCEPLVARSWIIPANNSPSHRLDRSGLPAARHRSASWPFKTPTSCTQTDVQDVSTRTHRQARTHVSKQASTRKHARTHTVYTQDIQQCLFFQLQQLFLLSHPFVAQL